jgi:hypothetical protein
MALWVVDFENKLFIICESRFNVFMSLWSALEFKFFTNFSGVRWEALAKSKQGSITKHPRKFYSLCPSLLECFDWNTNIKEYVRNL